MLTTFFGIVLFGFLYTESLAVENLSIQAGNISAGSSIQITEDTVINVDGSITINSIEAPDDGNSYILYITGDGTSTLTVTNEIGSYVQNMSLVINSGRIECKKIECDNITVNGGRLTVNQPNDDRSMSGGSSILITGGTVVVTSSGYGIIATNITISGGNVNSTISNSGNAIAICAAAGYGTLSISGGEITASATSTGNGIAWPLAGSEIVLSNMTIVEPENGHIITEPLGHYQLFADENDVAIGRIVLRGNNYNGGNGNGNGNGNSNGNSGGNVVPGRASTLGGIVTSGGIVTTGTPKVQAPKLPPCEHTYEWRVITEATATSDGEEDLVCTKCGDVKEKRGLAAMGIFETESANKILKAAPGATVNIDCKPWNSFGHAIKDAMTKRPDVTIKASFLSDGHKGISLKVTIPAGRTDLFDNNGYLGLCRAGVELGYDQ